MADVRVRLPLGTLSKRPIGVWESLRNPPGLGPGDRRFESGHPDFLEFPYRGCMSWFMRLSVKEESAGSIPAPGAVPFGRASQSAMAPVSKTDER